MRSSSDIPQIKCPDCKALMPYTAASCPNCKRRMVQAATSQTTKETTVCSKCQAVNSVAQVYCSNCHAVLPYSRRPSRSSSDGGSRAPMVIGIVIALVILIGIVASQKKSNSTYVSTPTTSLPSSGSGTSYTSSGSYTSDGGLGPMPKNSEWNGTVPEVDQYLKSHLNDYDSAEYVEWSEVKEVKIKDTSYWGVRLKLRAKNGFGAYKLMTAYFFIRNGRVVFTEGLD
jgi:ribosomal protein S26